MTTTQTDELVSESDYTALMRLALEVAWRVDSEEASSLTDLFTEDGSIATLGEPSIGHDAIRAWGQMMDTNSPIPGVRHVLTNFRFVADGEDGAVGTMYVTAYLASTSGQATTPFAMGRGTDRYRRTANGWTVTSRIFEPYFLRE
jgi:hypothetical protein